MAKRLTKYAPESDTLESYYERGASSVVIISTLALRKDSGMAYDNIETSIVIHRQVDFNKTQERFLTEPVQQACDADRTMQAVSREGDGLAAEKRRRAMRRYARTALEEQQRSVMTQKLTIEGLQANKVACRWIGPKKMANGYL